MPGRKLTCFVVKIHGEFYRKAGRIYTVHAVSRPHAMRLLKKVTGFKVFRSMYVEENFKCDPQSGEPCYYHLVAQPSYGITPEREIHPNSPEWDERCAPQPKVVIPPHRQKLIDDMHKRRKDLYD